jgi:hypothetical protein
LAQDNGAAYVVESQEEFRQTTHSLDLRDPGAPEGVNQVLPELLG